MEGNSWSLGPAETTPEAESPNNSLSNGAVTLSCSGCSGGKSVGYIGGSKDGTIGFNDIPSTASTKTTIRIKYANGDSTQRYATVSVNGEKHVLAFLPSEDGNTPSSSTLHADLESGDDNAITIGGYDGKWGMLLSCI